MYKVKGKFTNFTVIDNLKKEPDINQKLTSNVIHREFDSINGQAPRHSKNIAPRAVAQEQIIASQPLAKDTTIVAQPDCHWNTTPIGTTIHYRGNPTTWHMSPATVSGDIGCGVYCVKVNTHNQKIDFKKLDAVVENSIPSAFHDRDVPIDPEFSAKLATKFYMPIGKRMMYDLLYSLGTLGSGNHFLEFDRDKHQNLWLVIHCGSRHVGTDICKYYLQIAHDLPHHIADIKANRLIKALKAQGEQDEISAKIKELGKKYPVINNPYRTLSGTSLKHYLHDTVLGQKFAIHNRHIIAHVVLNKMDWTVDESFTTQHNYFDPRDNTIRKGAISGHHDELVSIPLNMRDGTIFAIAKGNAKFNYSLPHGAGRVLPRHIARKVLNMGQYIRDMKGIHSSSIDLFTLDEAPENYKDFHIIEKNIKPNAKILDRVKPIYNYKDHQSDTKYVKFQQRLQTKRKAQKLGIKNSMFLRHPKNKETEWRSAIKQYKQSRNKLIKLSKNAKHSGKKNK